MTSRRRAVIAVAEACFRGPRCGAASVVISYACGHGHDETVRSCEPHAWAILGEGKSCPACAADGHDVPVGAAVYCGRCRRGRHGDCQSLTYGPRAMAGVKPAHPNDWCACTCDMADVLVPGADQARELSGEAIEALFAEFTGGGAR